MQITLQVITCDETVSPQANYYNNGNVLYINRTSCGTVYTTDEQHL